MSAERTQRAPEAISHYSLMLAAVREWIEHDHPTAEYATVIVEVGDGLPAVQVPIIQAAYLTS